jgi:hypothetical protein
MVLKVGNLISKDLYAVAVHVSLLDRNGSEADLIEQIS